MNIFVTWLSSELQSHVILNQPKCFSEAENLAHLRDAVSKSSRTNPQPAASRIAQDQHIKQLESQVSLLLPMSSERQPFTQQSVHAVSSGLSPQASPIKQEISELQQENLT